jgi:sugar lactone lactonase YvrE
VSDAQTFTVSNGSGGAAATLTGLMAGLQGTDSSNFLIISDNCGAMLEPGATCQIAVAFSPAEHNGSSSAQLSFSSSSSTVTATLTGSTLSLLGLVAGDIGGWGTADGTGTSSRFGLPADVTSDGAGNLYVADAEAVRKIVVATGAVTTLAGVPRQAGAADGIGAAARFSNITAITDDGAGNLYVLDDHSLRKIVIATGTVTTRTDDRGAAVTIDGPCGITSDGAGTLYVADTHIDSVTFSAPSAAIRKVDTATGAVTTLADRTGVSVGFANLSDIACDRAGNLYVGDSGVLEQVVIATGEVKVIAGMLGQSGSADGIGAGARLSDRFAITSDGAGTLYLAEDDFVVRQVVLATGTVTTIAGNASSRGSDDGIGAAASFDILTGLATDGAGNLYVADIYNSAIRKVVTATGAVTTFAGLAPHAGTADGAGAAARFQNPGGIASDSGYDLYLADRANGTIRRIGVAGGHVDTLAGAAGLLDSVNGTGASARFLSPTAVASDDNGTLYVTDVNTIRKVVIATGAVTTLVGKPFQDPAGSADGVGAAARFNSLWGITSDGAGNLYVADSSNHTIRKVVIATRTVTTLAGTAGQAGSADGVGAAASFNFPDGVTSDGAGNLYVSDSGNDTIRKVVIATGAVTTLAGMAGQAGSADGTGAAARFTTPNGITSDGAGHLYVADAGNSTIRRVAIDSGTVSTVIGVAGRAGVTLGPLPGSVNGPIDVALLPTGELAIVDTVENAVLIANF